MRYLSHSPRRFRQSPVGLTNTLAAQPRRLSPSNSSIQLPMLRPFRPPGALQRLEGPGVQWRGHRAPEQRVLRRLHPAVEAAE